MEFSAFNFDRLVQLCREDRDCFVSDLVEAVEQQEASVQSVALEFTLTVRQFIVDGLRIEAQPHGSWSEGIALPDSRLDISCSNDVDLAGTRCCLLQTEVAKRFAIEKDVSAKHLIVRHRETSILLDVTQKASHQQEPLWKVVHVLNSLKTVNEKSMKEAILILKLWVRKHAEAFLLKDGYPSSYTFLLIFLFLCSHRQHPIAPLVMCQREQTAEGVVRLCTEVLNTFDVECFSDDPLVLFQEFLEFLVSDFKGVQVDFELGSRLKLPELLFKDDLKAATAACPPVFETNDHAPPPFQVDTNPQADTQVAETEGQTIEDLQLKPSQDVQTEFLNDLFNEYFTFPDAAPAPEEALLPSSPATAHPLPRVLKLQPRSSITIHPRPSPVPAGGDAKSATSVTEAEARPDGPLYEEAAAVHARAPGPASGGKDRHSHDPPTNRDAPHRVTILKLQSHASGLQQGKPDPAGALEKAKFNPADLPSPEGLLLEPVAESSSLSRLGVGDEKNSSSLDPLKSLLAQLQTEGSRGGVTKGAEESSSAAERENDFGGMLVASDTAAAEVTLCPPQDSKLPASGVAGSELVSPRDRRDVGRERDENTRGNFQEARVSFNGTRGGDNKTASFSSTFSARMSRENVNEAFSRKVIRGALGILSGSARTRGPRTGGEGKGDGSELQNAPPRLPCAWISGLSEDVTEESLSESIEAFGLTPVNLTLHRLDVGGSDSEGKSSGGNVIVCAQCSTEQEAKVLVGGGPFLLMDEGEQVFFELGMGVSSGGPEAAHLRSLPKVWISNLPQSTTKTALSKHIAALRIVPLEVKVVNNIQVHAGRHVEEKIACVWLGTKAEAYILLSKGPSKLKRVFERFVGVQPRFCLGRAKPNSLGERGLFTVCVTQLNTRTTAETLRDMIDRCTSALGTRTTVHPSTKKAVSISSAAALNSSPTTEPSQGMAVEPRWAMKVVVVQLHCPAGRVLGTMPGKLALEQPPTHCISDWRGGWWLL
uniref:Uncharacterized protein n=1 Tax=Chromera velia CCMP2878 TaxID=1169474 RepID=A0A0G4HVD2_9ALVE|eukprot:Cvel_8782.t1-p1 / transcript=Cvel_8782.t1 / gene=Cvel_8782 / organism=Chromera_velia_CCMP2878 / gene_product=hypothetical protein / transcript_product=hypothetical protein / location=Cvel_scaffold491:38560-53728(+) / protein_length=992 / sequence_SO=supercontig / SO=protein_coding / is_pseudo=false